MGSGLARAGGARAPGTRTARGRLFVVVAERPGRPVVDHAGVPRWAPLASTYVTTSVSPVLEGDRAVTRGLELLAGDLLVRRVYR